MTYVDGFVIPVPEKNIDAYRQIAEKARDIWLSHGAVDYKECVLEDSRAEWGVAFPENARAKPGETVVFAWITFKSREHRDSVNKAVMEDPRMKEMMDPNDQTFDCKRMAYGGFKVLVEAA